MKISDLTKNPDNPRTISEAKQKMLLKALRKFGDLSGIVFNRKTKRLVGGHQRRDIFDPSTPIVISNKYSKPTKTGTVAEGYIEVKGERFTYREVYWDEMTEKAATIAANKGAGEWDLSKLGQWVKDLSSFDVDFDLGLTMFDSSEIGDLFSDLPSSADDTGNPYTKKIESPIYEPTGPKPKIEELFDLQKTNSLIKRIEASKLSTFEKVFLKFAAQRHIVFNYEKIAEYYAHSEKETQEFMEDSVLVIIDFEKAIEKGFVTLSQEIADAYPADDNE